MLTATKKSSGCVAMTAASLRSLLSILSPSYNAKSAATAARFVRFANGRASLAGNLVVVHAACEYDGEPFLASYDTLLKIAASCGSSGSVLKIKPHGSGCVVHSAVEGKWALVSEPYEEWFEPYEEDVEYPLCRLPVDEFLRAAKGTMFAVDKKAPTALACELVQVRDGVVSFVASDGRRIAHVPCEIDQAVDDRSVLVPCDCFAAIASVAAKCSDESGVQFDVSAKYVRAEFEGEAEVVCAITNDAYMNWAKLLDFARPSMSEARSGALVDAIKKSSVCLSETTRGVRVRVADNELRIECESSERGSSAVGCQLVTSGGDAEAFLNPRFVDEWLKCNEPEEVVSFDLGATTNSPAYFECDGRQYLIAKIDAG